MRDVEGPGWINSFPIQALPPGLPGVAPVALDSGLEKHGPLSCPVAQAGATGHDVSVREGRQVP